MTQPLCSEAEKMTREQSASPLCHELRFGRIKASKWFEVARCKTAERTLVLESIIGAYKVTDTKFMKRGRSLEKEVLKCVEEQVKCKCTPCGFYIALLPYFRSLTWWTVTGVIKLFNKLLNELKNITGEKITIKKKLKGWIKVQYMYKATNSVFSFVRVFICFCSYEFLFLLLFNKLYIYYT